MKRLFLLISFFFLILCSFPKYSFAELQSIDISPNPTDGGEVTITIQTDDDKYSFYFFKTDGTSGQEAGGKITGNKSSSCTSTLDAPFSLVSCGNNVLVVKLNTAALVVKGSDTEYTIQVIPTSGIPYIKSGNFVVKGGINPDASFTIDSVSPNPIIPDQDIIVSLNVATEGEYRIGFDGESLNFGGSGDSAKENCMEGPCEIKIKVPKSFQQKNPPQVVLGALNWKTKEKASIELTIDTTTPAKKQSDPPCKPNTDTNGGVYYTCDTGFGFPISTRPADFITAMFQIILSISGGIALLLIIFSGYMMVMSQGNPEKIQEARDRLTSAIVGLLFIIFSLVILQIIGVDILHIPQFK